MSLRGRRLLALLAATLVPLGAYLGLRAGNFAREQAARSLASQVAVIARDGEGGGTPTILQYELFNLALTCGTWGLIATPGGVLYSDSGPHPRPPPDVLARVRARGAGAWNGVQLARSGNAVIGLAVREDEVRALVSGVLLAYGLGAGLALALAGLLGSALLRLGLAPLRLMARRAEQLSAASLDERLPETGAPDEVQSLARSLNRMLARLDDAFARLSAEEERTRQFAADASHELRTPLAALQGGLDVLERVGDDPAARDRLLPGLRREARRAGRLVNDLLTLTRLDAGEALHPEPLDVAALLRAVAQTAADLAPHLRFHVEAGEAELRADRARVEGALWNLVRNAVAATPPGATVTLRAREEPGQVTVSVVNPGELPPDFLERMFGRFVRGAAGGEGSGLGLAIVRATARAHGGDAFARNTGQGPEVGFTLPGSVQRPFSGAP
ncbi:integral membrane sensor signal transduction histidine kinase [Deinococcus aerius]|uniref:histidine kinase n=1 Tax=Deinococcus aerius TaxID=200253 RepID=A0A2I9DNQ5_9DEIO|nr:histidine kinase dimerization/phospho-acceptor domain-containing protein [Deinococcus aerius]GBF06731.1 integral membrane sensor signal transduction histidine kinase [Deinococcus aerius]